MAGPQRDEEEPPLLFLFRADQCSSPLNMVARLAALADLPTRHTYRCRAAIPTSAQLLDLLVAIAALFRSLQSLNHPAHRKSHMIVSGTIRAYVTRFDNKCRTAWSLQ